MYKTGHYNDVTREQMISFAELHSFAIITGPGNEYPVATQLPMEITEESGKIILSGHIMRNTDHHRAFEKNPNVLVIFSSPHAYVSAEWYANPLVGSTVNYMSVHMKGQIIFKDEQGTEEAVRKITEKHIGKESPASFDKLPKEYISRMVNAIAGFRIETESMEAVFKLSQDHDARDRENIIAQLEKRRLPGDIFIAGEMKAL